MTVVVASYAGPAAGPRDAVRFEVGDTGPTFEFSDAEIDYVVARAGTTLTAAADTADALAARFTTRSEAEQVGDVSVTWGKRADGMRSLATRLRDRAAGEIGTLGDTTPIGLGLADMTATGAPQFWLGMHDYYPTVT